jgi:hypothetical protein
MLRQSRWRSALSASLKARTAQQLSVATSAAPRLPPWLQQELGGFDDTASPDVYHLDRRIEMTPLDHSGATYTPTGTLNQRKVNDKNYRELNTVSAMNITSLAQIMNLHFGTLDSMRRAYMIPGAAQLHIDPTQLKRYDAPYKDSWGFVIPLLSQLLYANESRGVRQGKASAIAMTTKTMDLHFNTMAPKDKASKDAVTRQFGLELQTHADRLMRTLQTTATANLIVRLLVLHRELHLTVPTASEATAAAADVSLPRTWPRKHRELMHASLTRLAELLDQRTLEMETSYANATTTDQRSFIQLHEETAWMIRETDSAILWLADHEGFDQSRDDLEAIVVPRLSQCLERPKKLLLRGLEIPHTQSTGNVAIE